MDRRTTWSEKGSSGLQMTNNHNQAVAVTILRACATRQHYHDRHANRVEFNHWWPELASRVTRTATSTASTITSHHVAPNPAAAYIPGMGDIVI